MKKLFIFICIIIALLVLQTTGCTKGFFVGEVITVPTQPHEVVEEDELNEEEPVLDNNTDEELNTEQPIEDNNDGEKSDEEDINEEDIDEEDSNEEGSSEEVDNGEDIEKEQEITQEVIREFNTGLLPEIKMDLKYDKYYIDFDYLLILDAAKVRKGPGLYEEVIDIFQANEKVSLVSEVKGEYLEKWGTDSWYQVTWKEGEEVKTGFIYAPLGEVRHFKFEKMAEALNYLKGESIKGELAYISNYKNANGIPPLLNGSALDQYGYRRSQSAPGYDEPHKGSNFRYIPDGMLVDILEERDGFSKVKVIGWEGEYWVQNKYINIENTLKELKKVVIVDRTFQNQGVFEFNEGQWSLISYSFATTGKKGPYSLETPLGYYMAIQKRDKFLYYKDGTNEIAGYAPYAIRFSGGGYIHGVPVDYVIKDGRRIDPGMKEYLHTIGTTPRSHMCVRNFTSHAKFLYDWVEVGSSAIIVIE